MAIKRPLVVQGGVLKELPSGDVLDTNTIPVLTGDFGSGGTPGLVPAPAAGDAVVYKFLRADGTWAIVPANGGPLNAGGAFDFNANPTMVLRGGGGASTTYTVTIGAGNARSLGYDVAFTATIGGLTAAGIPTGTIGGLSAAGIPTGTIGGSNAGTPTFVTIGGASAYG